MKDERNHQQSHTEVAIVVTKLYKLKNVRWVRDLSIKLHNIRVMLCYVISPRILKESWRAIIIVNVVRRRRRSSSFVVVVRRCSM